MRYRYRRMHISKAELRNFILGELAPNRNKRIAAHLLTGCGRCNTAVNAVCDRLESSSDEYQAERLQAVTAREPAYFIDLRTAEREMDQERMNAYALHATIKKTPENARKPLVQNNPLFHNLGLFQYLMRESLAARDEHSLSWKYLEYAYLIAENLPEIRYTPGIKVDCLAEVTIEMAAVLRIRGEFQKALDYLSQSRILFKIGTGDPLIEARYLSILASVLKDLGSFERASQHLIRACTIYRAIGERYHLISTQITAACVLKYYDPVQGYLLAQEANKSIVEEFNLETPSLFAMVDCLNESGAWFKARALFQLHSSRFAEVKDPYRRLLVQWLAARINLSIFLSTGDESHGESAELVLSQLADDFSSLARFQEMGLALVYLAELYTAREELGKAREALQVALSVFKRENLPLDCCQALSALLNLENRNRQAFENARETLNRKPRTDQVVS